MANELDDRTYALLFGVRRSVRYHSHRRRFYEIWNSVTVTLSVLGGSSAATAIISDIPEALEWLPASFAALVAIIAALDLAIGTARRADVHSDLSRRFIGLEQRFAPGKNLTDDEYEAITRARLEIEAGEPTILRLLDLMCHYELLRAIGDKSKHPQFPWLRRKSAHWLSQGDYVQAAHQAHSVTPQS